MTTRELLLQEIAQIPDARLEKLLELVKQFNRTTCYGREVVPADQLEAEWPVPPEAGYRDIWERLNRNENQ